MDATDTESLFEQLSGDATVDRWHSLTRTQKRPDERACDPPKRNESFLRSSSTEKVKNEFEPEGTLFTFGLGPRTYSRNAKR
jgi:hypothetical protein